MLHSFLISRISGQVSHIAHVDTDPTKLEEAINRILGNTSSSEVDSDGGKEGENEKVKTC